MSTGKIRRLKPFFNEKDEDYQLAEEIFFNLSEIIIPFSEFYKKQVLIEKDANFKEILIKEFL